MQIDTLVETFLRDHASGIATMHRLYYHSTDELSLRALKAELVEEIKTGCITFCNKDLPLEELDPYLFYIVNDYCKKQAKPQIKKKTEYLCPACLFLGKQKIIEQFGHIFKCNDCASELNTETDPKKVFFFRTFFRHNKVGYRCQYCDRFIPQPIDESPTVSCPYFDCCFVGQWQSLKRMHHPTIQSNPEKLILDVAQEKGGSLKDTIVSQDLNALSQLEIKEELDSEIDILRNVIDSQKNSVSYSSSDFTVKHKIFIYQAFANLLEKYPEQMVNYLLHESRSGGFQHKIFQEYIKILESSLPFMFKKNKKHFRVDSLLDKNLNLFDGISVFDTFVSDNLVAKNNTQEFYIGGRKAKVAKPYYIGKILNVVDKKAKIPIVDNIKEYTFSLIKFQDIKPATEITVTHLRIPPHYQMGGMVYVNRIRKKIVDRAQILLSQINHD